MPQYDQSKDWSVTNQQPMNSLYKVRSTPIITYDNVLYHTRCMRCNRTTDGSIAPILLLAHQRTILEIQKVSAPGLLGRIQRLPILHLSQIPAEARRFINCLGF